MKFTQTLMLLMAFGLMGLVSCKSKTNAEKAQVADKKEVASTTAGTEYNVVPGGVVNWIGMKPAGQHTGTVNISQGKLVVNEDSKVVGGKFTLDMNSITVTDLQAGDGKEDLETHLKGLGDDNKDHFFDVRSFPTASFEVTKVVDYKSEADSDTNSIISGNLTLKDVTKEITFKADVQQGGDMVKVRVPKFAINRTDFGIKFMSKNFFDDLKDKYIDDEIVLSITFDAKK